MPYLLILFSLIFFFGIIFFFGWQLAVFLLKENRVYILLPFSGLLGVCGYVFLLNVLSYFIAVQISFYLILGLLLALGLLFRFLNRGRQRLDLGLPKKQFLIVGAVFAVIMLSSGLVALRALEYDDVAVGHINLAPTISEGNFPVRNVLDPSNLFAYHYAPDLFTAAIFKITALPVEFGYDVQMFIFSGLIFLMGFLLIYEFTNNSFLGVSASFLMLFGGGFTFINFFKGLPILYQKFVLHQQVFTPWHFLSGAIDAHLFNPLIATIHNHSGAMGMSILLCIVYLYFRSLKENRFWLRISILNGFLLGFLALSVETYFAVLFAVFLMYPFVILLFRRDRSELKKKILISCVILSIALPIALFEGGVITEFIRNGYFLKLFSIHGASPSGLLKEMDAPSYHILDLFISFGFPLLLFIPASFYFKKYRYEMVFFVLIVVISFVAPFLVQYSVAAAMKRFFFLTEAFLSLTAGLYLSSLFFRLKTENKRRMMKLIWVIFFFCISGGLIWQTAYMAFPIGNIGRNKPFLGRATAMSKVEKEADQWIKTNTTIEDAFFVYYQKSIFSYPTTEFSALHGRFAPMEIFRGEESQTQIYLEAPAYYQSVKDCDSEFFKYHRIKYIYVTSQWPAGLEQICKTRHKADLVFEIENNEDFRRIYKINP